MKIFITGGTGFVGSALTKNLLEEDHEVTIVSSKPHGSPGAHDKLQHIVADTTKVGEWQEKVAEIDVIINLAGRSVFNYWTEKYKKQIWESRILTTRNLVNAMKPDQQVTLLSCSAAGYYGNAGDKELDENSVCGHGFLASVCQEWEAEAKKAEEKGARVALMRLGVVLGAGGGAIATMKTPFSFGLGGPIGSGNQWFPWIHLNDLIAGILYIIQNRAMAGAFNFTAPKVVKQKDFAKTLGAILKRPAILPAPSFVMKLILGEFGDSLLQGQKVIPKKLITNGFTFTYPDVMHALQEIFSE